MTEKTRIVYTCPKTGNTCIVIPAKNVKVADIISREPLLKTGIPYRVTQVSNLPADRELRDAWTDDFDTDTVDICAIKAKEVALRDVREKREKAFAKLDQKHLIAFFTKNAAALEAIEKEKTLLRDLTEDLKALEVANRQDFNKVEHIKNLKKTKEDYLNEE